MSGTTAINGEGKEDMLEGATLEGAMLEGAILEGTALEEF